MIHLTSATPPAALHCTMMCPRRILPVIAAEARRRPDMEGYA